MNLHFPLPKNRTIGDELTLSLAKNSPKIRTFRFSLHTSRLSLRGEVTILALKFAMSSHFPLPKVFRPQALFPLKESSRQRPRSAMSPKTPGEVRARTCGTKADRKHCALSIHPKFVPFLSSGTSRATSDRKPKTNDQILPSPIFLPIEKMNQINTKNYWK